MHGFRSMRLLAGVLVTLALFAAGSGDARADIVSHFQSVSGSAGNFTWTYAPENSGNSTIVSGDYIELVDFNGYNGQHSEPTGWTLVSSLSGPVPSQLQYKDDPTVTNLVWKYTGSTPLSGTTDLGTFTAGSTSGALGTGFYVAQATLTSNLAQGIKSSNIGFDTLPAVGNPLDHPAPEPSVLLVLAVSLPVVLPLMRHRQRRARAQVA
jgi:hypothetical protein